MNPTWLVNANHSYAQIFSFSGVKANGGAKEVASLYCPEARQHDGDLVSDDAGRSFDSGGQGRHALEPSTDQKRQIAKKFAKDIAQQLEQGRQQKAFEDLVLIAPPDFLGDLRSALSSPCKQTVVHECKKNLIHQDLAHVVSHVPFPLNKHMEQALRAS